MIIGSSFLSNAYYSVTDNENSSQFVGSLIWIAS